MSDEIIKALGKGIADQDAQHWALERIEELEAKLERAVLIAQSVVDACNQGRRVPRPGYGAGGMSIDANIRNSVYYGVPAWPVEEAINALADLKGGDV